MGEEQRATPPASSRPPTGLTSNRWLLIGLAAAFGVFASIDLVGIDWVGSAARQRAPAVGKGTAQTPRPVCTRAAPHPMRAEFERGVSLAMQRLSEHGEPAIRGYATPLQAVRNCLVIEYAPRASDLAGAEGVFRFSTDSRPDELAILVDPNYAAKSDLYTAILLSHEMTHAASFAHGWMAERQRTTEGCFVEEAYAFDTELVLLEALNVGEKLQIIDGSFAAESLGTPNDANAIVELQRTILTPNGGNSFTRALAWVRAQPHDQRQCRR